MSYSQQFLCADNASNADWWSWGTAISTFLGTTLTWTKTDNNVTWGTTTVPSSGSYVYEVWKCNDTMSSSFPYYMKVEYGNTTNNCPLLRISFSTGPSSSGTLSGNIIGPFYLQSGNTSAETSAATFECNLSGDTGARFGLLMWRTAGNANRPCFLSVERSQNSTGTYTSGYITVVVSGYNSGVVSQQQSLYNPSTGISTPIQTNWATIATNLSSLLTLNEVPFLPVFPLVGLTDFCMTGAGVAKINDVVEGSTISASLYGTSHNFIVSSMTNFNGVGLGGNSAVLLRAD